VIVWTDISFISKYDTIWFIANGLYFNLNLCITPLESSGMDKSYLPFTVLSMRFSSITIGYPGMRNILSPRSIFLKGTKNNPKSSYITLFSGNYVAV